MVKIYKSNNKLIIYLPDVVINSLNLKIGEEIDFLEYGNKSFLVAKKDDIAKFFITGMAKSKDENINAYTASENLNKLNNINNKNTDNINKNKTYDQYAITAIELNVLRKLNNLKFANSNKPSIQKILNDSERKVLESLIKKKFVLVLRKNNEFIYSISKYIYPKLRGNDFTAASNKTEADANYINAKEAIHSVHDNISYPNSNIIKSDGSKVKTFQDSLETNGYLVLSSETDAAELSKSMEESIRTGTIIGTRAFNKKFYIGLKKFIVNNTPKIIGVIGSKKMSVDEISKQLNIEPDGILTILYILAENGEVTELKENIFKLVI